jgi:hypothetical protein
MWNVDRFFAHCIFSYFTYVHIKFCNERNNDIIETIILNTIVSIILV